MRLVVAAWLLLAGAAAAAEPTPGHLAFLGVNLSGAEFGVLDEARHLTATGTPGHDYTFPTRAEIDAYAAAGFNVARLPFTWERLQPTADGPLDAAYLAGLDGVVRAAAAKGMAVILEPAGMGYGYGSLIGSAATPGTAFADLWRRLARHYTRAPGVMFGLMNEPHDQAPGDWLGPAQAAIDAIRATGAQQEILVPGTGYSHGSDWLSHGNAAQFADHITDPARNMAFEIHQYTDADESGRSATPVSPTIGAERLQAITAWAEANGHRLFLAEFGSGIADDSLTAMRNQLAFVAAHSAAWQGAAIWGGGPWWPPDYPMAVESMAGALGPQVQAMQPFAPAHR